MCDRCYRSEGGVSFPCVGIFELDPSLAVRGGRGRPVYSRTHNDESGGTFTVVLFWGTRPDTGWRCVKVPNTGQAISSTTPGQPKSFMEPPTPQSVIDGIFETGDTFPLLIDWFHRDDFFSKKADRGCPAFTHDPKDGVLFQVMIVSFTSAHCLLTLL